VPIHDWTRVDAGLFHDFHQSWTVSLRNALNAGVLPNDFFALVEQRIQGPIPDVLTWKLSTEPDGPSFGGQCRTILAAPPSTQVVRRTESGIYAGKANRVTVRHRHGDVVAIIEIVSPGNKAGRAEFQAFVKKAAELLRQDVHLLVIDLFPPSPRDPQGIHKAIRDEFEEEDFALSADKRLILASYDATGRTAYVEPIAVGEALPDMPLFIRPGTYVPAPLEASYQVAWETFPRALKGLLEGS